MTYYLFFEKQKAQNLSMGCMPLKEVRDLANGRRQYSTAVLEELRKTWYHSISPIVLIEENEKV